MSKACASHPERAAATTCHRCKKAVCRSCVLVTPDGSYCSSECMVLQREQKDRERAEKEGWNPGGYTKGAAVFAFIFAFFILLHIGATWGSPRVSRALSRIDLIGKFLGSLDRLKR